MHPHILTATWLSYLSFLQVSFLSYQIVATYGFRLITTCLLFIIAFLYAPVEAKNKRLPTEKKRKYRHISICLTGFDVILAAIDILPLSRFITIYYFSKWALIIFAVHSLPDTKISKMNSDFPFGSTVFKKSKRKEKK